MEYCRWVGERDLCQVMADGGGNGDGLREWRLRAAQRPRVTRILWAWSCWRLEFAAVVGLVAAVAVDWLALEVSRLDC